MFLRSYIIHFLTILICIEVKEVISNTLQNNKISSLKSTTKSAKNNEDVKLGENFYLPPDYDKTIPPGENDTILHFSINHPRVIKISQELMTYQVNLNEIVFWKDPRITSSSNSNSNMSNDEITYRFKSLKRLPIWTPMSHLDFRDVKLWQSRKHTCDLRVAPKDASEDNVTLVYITFKGRSTIYCDYDFNNFPLDHQVCYFRVDLESSHDYDVKLNNLDNYTAESYEACGFRITTLGINTNNSDTMAGFDLHMERIIRPYLFQYYLPCAAIVMMSQISFIIPMSAIPGRVALVTTLFLSLTNIYINQMVRFSIDLINQVLFLYSLIKQKISTK